MMKSTKPEQPELGRNKEKRIFGSHRIIQVDNRDDY